MERDFEKQLRGFHAIASREAEGSVNSEETEDLVFERAAALAEAVELTKTDQKTQEEVYALQKKKFAIMQKLAEQLKVLDDPSHELREPGRSVSFDSISDTYLMREKGGGQVAINRGEIMTGGAWGQQYRLDRTVPRDFRKQYIIGSAHRELHELFNQQIAITEARSWFNENTGKDSAYQGIADRAEKPLLEQGSGVIAERMVASLLMRLAIDYDLPFEVIQTDAHADVEHKIDFIIRVKENYRGVSVETPEEGHDIGIQFTMRTADEDLKRKKKQAARASRSLAIEEGETVEKIVVVSVPVDKVRSIVAEWQQNQKNRKGGPDVLLSKDMQEKIFKGVLKDVFPEEAVTEMWAKAQQSLPKTV